MFRPICLFLFLLVLPVAHGLDFTPLETVAVQENGRKKPFLVFADEAILGLTGRTSLERDGRKLGSIEAVVSMWLAPSGWEKVPLVLVNNKKLKEQVGLDRTRKLFSYEEIAANKPLLDLFQEANETRARNSRVRLTGTLKAAADVGMRLAIFEGLVSGRLVTPLPTGAAAWSPLGPDDPALALLRRGFQQGDQQAFNNGVALLRKEQAAENPRFQADPWKIEVETFYQKLHPFRWAWVLYLAAGISLLAFVGRAAPWGYAAGWAFALAGFGLQVLGFVCRIIVSGRAPVTNMYESVLWVAFGTIFFALVFEAIHRCRYFLLGAVPVAVVSLILADTQPVILDRTIQPLVPVLADNFWLTTHVLTITLSYAAFALALGVGHIVLGKVIFGSKPSPALYNYLYRSLQIGVLLLAVGTILGGVWANYSWGRFWDWDPKETWALIALLGYLIVLHGRIAGKWGGFGMAVGAVLAFQSIIMAWYGVNFVLGVGLHSYGFGTGGFPAALGFVIVEVAFVALAVWRNRSKPVPTAPAVA
ncbi:MAG: cytochrome c biogenesis protein CcsA [Terrimicrobiaceae bacterium]|nr:cytochrome c biogenesis protein CcsA [Terrimicrobiaceae bacterium]